MLRFLTLFCLVASVIACANVAIAQEQNQPQRSRSASKADTDKPMSVFNDQVKRFRFHIEGVLVTVDEAEAFMVRLGSNREKLGVIGAYPDYRTNSLFVVASPESENEIRKQLATWIVQVLNAPPLKAQRRQLIWKRKKLLREMAELEMSAVGLEKNKAAQIFDRNDLLREELEIIETKIEIVDKYQQRKKATKRSGANGGSVTKPKNATAAK